VAPQDAQRVDPPDWREAAVSLRRQGQQRERVTEQQAEAEAEVAVAPGRAEAPACWGLA